MTEGAGSPLSVLRSVARTGRRGASSLPSPDTPAETDPVAHVVVDVPLPHLGRPFAYLVPQALADLAVPGARVRVRFAGQDVDGFVVQRGAASDHAGPLSPLTRVVSPEPVLTPAMLALCQAVADRYAGTLGDVLRLAIPPRHARAERALAMQAPQPEPLPTPAPGPWSAYPAGPAFLRRAAAGEAPAASWLAAPRTDPAQDWPVALAVAAATTLTAGRGVLVVCPDGGDVERVDSALTSVLGLGRHVRLSADQGPQARYTAWLKLLRGHVRCVVGTRAAALAPVHDLGLVAWWDDGDDSLAEPRAPYPHVREVLRLRAALEGSALLVGGHGRSVAVQRLVNAGELRTIAAAGGDIRRNAPRVIVAGEGAELERDPAAVSARLPSVAWRSARAALESGPVLVQVPRRGYLPALSCQSCRAPARCASCHGPLALAAPQSPPQCRWCDTVTTEFECRVCSGRTLRSTIVGARRTAEELGRAFPGVAVHTSGGGAVLARVPAASSLVIATPGAEPVADDGYAATLLLDAWSQVDRPVLDAEEEALRRWLAATALTRGAAAGGVVVLCGVPPHVGLPCVEALVRFDPAWFAQRELAERASLGLPPTVRMARLVGSRRALREALKQAELPDSVQRLGPMPLASSRPRGTSPDGDAERLQLLLRTSLDEGPAMVAALHTLRAVRSARKEIEALTVRIDPGDSLG